MEEGFQYPMPDDEEDLAETQKAREQFLEDRDAAVEDLDLDGETVDLHAEEREALGFHLAWWDEEGEEGAPTLDIASGLANEACSRIQLLSGLKEHGYNAEEMVAYPAISSLDSGLIVAGLMILGTIHFHIREDVKATLKRLWDAIPEATEEQMEAYAKAYEALNREALASMGIVVVNEDDELHQHDAGLN